jgi:hypothetical protein
VGNPRLEYSGGLREALSKFALAAAADVSARSFHGGDFTCHPVIVQDFEQPLERLETGWLYVIRTGAEEVGGTNVVNVAGAGKDDGRDDSPLRVAFEVFEYGKAVGLWHLQVSDNERGISILTPISVFSFAHDISDGFFAVAEEVYWAGNANFPEGELDELSVGGFIVNDQNSPSVSCHRKNN